VGQMLVDHLQHVVGLSSVLGANQLRGVSIVPKETFEAQAAAKSLWGGFSGPGSPHGR
jgi:hypothetical protein